MRIFIVMVMILLSSVLLGAEKKSTPPPSLVTTAPIDKGVVNPVQTYVGTLYYDKQSKLASESEGLVSTLSFREGQKVKKGAVLIKLDSQILQANIAAKQSTLEALEANLERQERDLKRTKALFERDSISESSYDEAVYGTRNLRATVNATRSELQAMKIQLDKTRIKAPFDAVVVARNVEVGEWVGKGNVVASLIATDTLEAHLNIPARLIETLKSYKSFTATIENHEIDVTLKAVIPLADKTTRTFLVELNIPKNDEFIEGMRIDVQVPTLKEQTSFLVPRDAVIKRFGQTVIFTVQNGMAVMNPIHVIGYKKNLVAIAGAGLKENMRVVTKGNERIFPNMPVVEK